MLVDNDFVKKSYATIIHESKGAEVSKVTLMGSKMENYVDVLHCLLHVAAIADVTYKEVNIAGNILRLFSFRVDGGSQAIQDPHCMTPFQEKVHGVRTDKTSATSY